MKNRDNTKVAVIGAGAAGLMAAISAANYGADVTVIERNPFAGKKLRITGKGRCNVTNACTPSEVLEATVHNPKFLYGALNRFSPADVMEFFESCGVRLKTERGRRVFPESDKAADIRDALVNSARDAGVRFVYNARVKAVEADENGGYTVSWGQSRLRAEAVIFATGGVSYTGTGSTGDGHALLERLGVNITPLSPSLVPIETEEDLSDLSGLTLKNVKLRIIHGGALVREEMGEMLFTHFGVSGPLVLSASSNMQAHPIMEYGLFINLKPALSREELDRRVLSDFAKFSARDLVNSLDELLPKKLIPYVIAQSGIDGRRKTCTVTREERERLLTALDSFAVTPRSFRPIEEAIITSGGVDVKEINPRTMELRSRPGIFVCGELIDVDAYTGGYNLQIAFSTGKLAGESAACV